MNDDLEGRLERWMGEIPVSDERLRQLSTLDLPPRRRPVGGWLRLLGAAAVAGLLVLIASFGLARPPLQTGTTNLDPTGILLVGIGENVQARPASEALAQAFDQALRIAMANPNDLGYPWLDPSTDELVLSAATGQGRRILETATFTVAHRIRDVAHSYAELQQIQDDVTRLLAAGVTDAQLIYMTYPDQRDNRTLITVSRMSRPLLEELARRFGSDAIAIEVAPN